MAQRTCSVPGCSGPHEARGFCNRHYLKAKKYGSPLAGSTKNAVRPPCSVDGCTGLSSAQGRCQTHYDTWRHYGRTTLLTRADRFWAKVERGEPADCWPYIGCRNRYGYGKSSMNGRVVGAHRLSFFLAHGYWPVVVRHACDNPPCVNPAHLLPGTFADNSADAVERGRSARGERSGTARLTESQVREIRQRAARGETQRSIARAYGVTFQLIHCVVRRKIWMHVD